MNSEHAVLVEQIYQNNFKELLIHAHQFTDYWPICSDAVYEAFYVACEKADSLLESPNPVGWMKNTVRNCTYALRRVKQKECLNFVPLEELFDISIPCRQPESNILKDCSIFLSTTEYYLVVKFYYYGDSYQNIARDLGISVSACRKRMQRALCKLRKKLELSDYD